MVGAGAATFGGSLAESPSEMRHFKDDLEAVTAEAEELIRTDDCRASTLEDLDS